MKEEINFSSENIQNLVKFLENNKGKDFVTYDLNQNENIEILDFKGLTKQKSGLLPLIKAYQRLIRIVPENDSETALLLLKEGFHSALQIASMTRKDFLSRLADVFNDQGKLADAIYKSAQEKRGLILIQYMNMLQNREPHISAARFN